MTDYVSCMRFSVKNNVCWVLRITVGFIRTIHKNTKKANSCTIID